MSGQLSLTGAQLQKEIMERGYAEYQHGISDGAIEYLVDTYATFTLAHPDPEPVTMNAMLPDGEDPDLLRYQLDELDRSQDDQTEWHKYRTNAGQLFKPDGYTNRSYQEDVLRSVRGVNIPAEDPKEYFHFTPKWYANMARNHEAFGWGPIPPEVKDLNQAFTPIHRRATELMMRVCGDIEEVHPEIQKFVTSQSLMTSPLRLLFYHPTNRPELAYGHYDKGLATLQIGESHQGLHIARDYNDSLQPVLRNSDTAAFFAGSGLARFFPDTVFQPAWHSVVATNQLNEGRSVPLEASEVCARWALIFFANGQGDREDSKAAMHTR